MPCIPKRKPPGSLCRKPIGITSLRSKATRNIRWFEDRGKWERLTSIEYEKKTITNKKTKEKHVKERYYLCSMKPIAELFAIAVRRHWNILSTAFFIRIFFKGHWKYRVSSMPLEKRCG